MKKLGYLLVMMALSAFVFGCAGADTGTTTTPSTESSSDTGEMEDAGGDAEEAADTEGETEEGGDE
jgi:hypothetical protein